MHFEKEKLYLYEGINLKTHNDAITISNRYQTDKKLNLKKNMKCFHTTRQTKTGTNLSRFIEEFSGCRVPNAHSVVIFSEDAHSQIRQQAFDRQVLASYYICERFRFSF